MRLSRRAWLLASTLGAAACGSTVAVTMDGGPSDGAGDAGGPRDGGHDGSRAADGRAPDGRSPDAPAADAAGDDATDGGAGDAGDAAPADAGSDAPPGDAGSCVPPAALPGDPCDSSASCGKGLTCDLSGSWKDGLGPDASVRCLEHAGACCTGGGDCLSGICDKGACAKSPLDNSCGSTSDCVPDAEPFSPKGTYCYKFIYGFCCPVGSPPYGAPPGCPGA